MFKLEQKLFNQQNLIKNSFQQFYRDAVPGQTNNFVSGKKCIISVKFNIVIFEVLIISISKTHKKEALSGCEIPEFGTVINTAIKIEVARIRIAVLFCGNGANCIKSQVNLTIYTYNLRIIFPDFSSRDCIIGGALNSLLPEDFFRVVGS